MSNQPWFYAPPSNWSGDAIVLPADESHHATKVVRVAPMDVVTVFDGGGRVARCGVGELGAELTVEILDSEVKPRPRPQLVVYQGAAKGGRLDAAVERLAEIGVAELAVFASERSVVRWDGGKLEKLSARWASLARSAAKQSRNPHLLEAHPGLTWAELLERVAAESAAVTLWENAELPLRTALPPAADRIAIVVGPEGGLSPHEADALADAGAPLVSLGPQILRTENAALVAASALGFHYGLLG